jgi:hypothetical protein
MTHLVFLDTETTGLAEHCEVWEIGLIVRTETGDEEFGWRIRPDLTTAEPTGLLIGRYYQRMSGHAACPVGYAWQFAHPDDEDDPLPANERHTSAERVATQVAQLLDGVTIVGAVPDFDARHLTRFLRANGQASTWHYHLVDVETLAGGRLRMPPPWDFDELLQLHGLVYDETDRHTALGDARMVRDLYDRALGSGVDE